jgi:hypothetical protein
MTATDIETDVFTITVTHGTDASNVVLGTVNGAIKDIDIIRIAVGGEVSTYHIVVHHDDVGTTALEYTTRSLDVTNGTPVIDDVFATVAGVVQKAQGFPTIRKGELSSYDLIAVHLNA